MFPQPRFSTPCANRFFIIISLLDRAHARSPYSPGKGLPGCRNSRLFKCSIHPNGATLCKFKKKKKLPVARDNIIILASSSFRFQEALLVLAMNLLQLNTRLIIADWVVFNVSLLYTQMIIFIHTMCIKVILFKLWKCHSCTLIPSQLFMFNKD